MAIDDVTTSLPTIADLGRAYRTGAFTPVDVLEGCLARIAAWEAKLNAVITLSEPLAREQAERASREIAQGIDRGPLHGIPVGIKDIIDVAGLPTTYASNAVSPRTPAQSAALVNHLETAGAVFVAKTNVLEFASGALHPAFGQTNNPWDISRISGGSSSGSGAGVAAGFFAAAVGTDTGGSIRGPASYCGIAGLKPTFDLVDTTGVYPLSPSLDHAGPMARTPLCALAMLDGMAGRSSDLTPHPLGGIRFTVIDAFRRDPALSVGIAAAFDAGIAALEAAGGERLDVDLPALGPCDRALIDIILPEATAVHEAVLAINPEGYGPQTRLQLEMGFETLAIDYVKANRFRADLRRDFDAAFDQVDLLVCPTVAWVAPSADIDIVDDEGTVEMRFMGPFNLTGHPALSIPCGLAEDGLPAGLQVVGPCGGDSRLLRIAESWTRHMPLPDIKLKQ
ncbi:MAG: amidase [Pseudomonadota bacterium]